MYTGLSICIIVLAYMFVDSAAQASVTTATPTSSIQTSLSSTNAPGSSSWTNSTNAFDSAMETSSVEGCFGKIRTAASVDPVFRATMDRMSKVARLDLIDELLRKKIRQLCNEAEAEAAKAFLDKEKPSVHIAELVASNLTNEEKDRLKLWENLNDTISERAFFLSKYEKLPKEQYQQLTKSFSDVLNKFVGSDLKGAIARFLIRLTPIEQHDLKTFGVLCDEEKIVALVDGKLKSENVSTAERDEIKGYVKGLFMTPKST